MEIESNEINENTNNSILKERNITYNNKNIDLLNDISLNTKSPAKDNDEYVLGIDEAGRGPVLGPMVYGCAYWKKDDEAEINKKYKFDDSKKLTDKIRRQLFKMIQEDSRIFYHFEIHAPWEISRKMIRRKQDVINLNIQSHNSAAKLMNIPIANNFNITQVYADTVGPKDKYTDKLRQLCIKKTGIAIKAEEKADSKYKVVSAASIVAKVVRDEIVENWEYIENNGVIKFSNNKGSGYPADPYTKAWLKNSFNEVFGYPNIVRFSWSTVSKVLLKEAKKNIFVDFSDEPDKTERKNYVAEMEKEKNTTINGFVNKRERFDYYKKRGLDVVCKENLF